MSVSRPSRTPPTPKQKVLKMTWARAAALMARAELGKVAEHDGVDQRHGNPAELAGDERQSQVDERRELAAYVTQLDAHT